MFLDNSLLPDVWQKTLRNKKTIHYEKVKGDFYGRHKAINTSFSEAK